MKQGVQLYIVKTIIKFQAYLYMKFIISVYYL